MRVIEISDDQNLTVSLLDFGARIVSVDFSNRPLALTYKDVNSYKTDPFYLGATIGPITNRIANAQLTIDQQAFKLPANEGKNCLHSGGAGFDKQFWTLLSSSSNQAIFELNYDLAQIGMSGILQTQAYYRVDNGALSITYSTTTDTRTYINLTNHVYLNLSSHNRSINDHVFTLFADSFVNVDQDNIPTGETTELTKPLTYNFDTNNTPFSEFDGLCDHHFNVNNHDKEKVMATAYSNSSNIKLTISSNSPGFQFYTGKFLSAPFTESGGFCVETQLAPDAINQPDFYSPLLEPGELRTQTTIYQFS